MSTDRWKRVNELFEAALERDAQARSAFLAAECAGEDELRREVESLLDADRQAEGFLDTTALKPIAPRPLLQRGQRLGPYEVVEVLGQGGMGYVYRARDTRLPRDVALKVLSSSIAAGPRLARFRIEARAVSALNHPNVVTVYDVGEDGGTPYFAMELVEGRTLRDLEAQGPLPLRSALSIAVQVAEGLAAAHAGGVVHRDLKPENVIVTADGLAKVVDFGLAKTPPLAPSAGHTASLVTLPGSLLGTIGYMSPEQASSREADFRSDHFSFGSLLYEMVTGRRAFRGPTDVETLAAIIQDEPEPPASEVPLPLAWILRRCLAKDPRARYGSTLDLAHDLRQLRDGLAELAAKPLSVAPAGTRRALPWVLALALVAAVALVAGFGRGRPESPPPPFLRHLTYTGSDSAPTVSPDGRTVAFTSSRDGRPRIWLMHLVTGAEAALTEGPDDRPSFAPDGGSVLFARTEAEGASLFSVSVLGGAARRVLRDARSGAFSPDGRRLAFVRFARRPGSRPLYLVGVANADGSAQRVVETIEATSVAPLRWSPDSRRLAVSHASGAALVWSILVLDPDGSERRTLQPPDRFGSISPPVWAREGRALVYAQSDAVEGNPSGRLLLQEVPSGATRTLLRALHLGGSAELAGAGRAVLTMQPIRGQLRELPLLAGGGAARWLTRGSSDDRQACYAPDGRRLVFSSNRHGQLDLWEVALDSGAVRRLTDHPAEDWDPRVARDGRIVWSSKRGGTFEVWMAESDGSAPRQVTHDGVDAENPDITPDGAWIVYTSGNPARRGIWKVRTDGTEATQLAAGNLGLPEVSPDGRLLLYAVFNPPTTSLRVLRLADGAAVPFEIRLPSGLRSDVYFIRGRARWFPDGRGIAFVDFDAQGRPGIVAQDFVPGADTSASRRPLFGFDGDAITESFGFSPDGARLAVTLKQRSSDLVLAEGIDGLDRD